MIPGIFISRKCYYSARHWLDTRHMSACYIKFDGSVLEVGLDYPAKNNEIVRDATAKIDKMVKSKEIAGGQVIKINGTAPFPVAIVIGHAVAHQYMFVAWFDPELGRYLVIISHNEKVHKPGDLID